MNDKLIHIELMEEGFRVLEGGLETAVIDWLHLKQIVAYRQDPEGADLLCLDFRKSHDNQYIEINEEMDGYCELLEAIYDKFPSINRNWWQDVAAPLGTNRQTIYGMSLSDDTAPKAAEQYLNNVQKRKKYDVTRKFLLIALLTVAIITLLILLIY